MLLNFFMWMLVFGVLFLDSDLIAGNGAHEGGILEGADVDIQADPPYQKQR